MAVIFTFQKIVGIAAGSSKGLSISNVACAEEKKIIEIRRQSFLFDCVLMIIWKR